MAINANYSVGCSICVGVFHVLFGLSSCGCGIASIVFGTPYYVTGLGIWAGVAFYFVTGILAFVSGKRNNCVITAHYIMALFSVLVSMSQMGLYSWALYVLMDHCWSYDLTSCLLQWSGALPIAFIAIGLGELIVAAVSCCISCSCCKASAPPTQTIVLQTGPFVPPNAVYAGQAGVLGQSSYNGQRVGGAPILSGQPAGGIQAAVVTTASGADGHPTTTHVNQGFLYETRLPHTPFV